MNILIENPQRTASVRNMLVNDVTYGKYVILVDSHITADTWSL